MLQRCGNGRTKQFAKSFKPVCRFTRIADFPTKLRYVCQVFGIFSYTGPRTEFGSCDTMRCTRGSRTGPRRRPGAASSKFSASQGPGRPPTPQALEPLVSRTPRRPALNDIGGPP